VTAVEYVTRYARNGDGTYVAYQVSGQGDIDVVPLIGHGISVEDQLEGAECRKFIERLERFARVIRFDRRGTGLSDPVPQFDTSTWEHWVDDAEAVLDATGSTGAAFVGTDGTTSVTALLIAATSPRATHLAIHNPAARWLIDDDYPWGMTQDAAEKFLDIQLRDRLENRLTPGTWAAQLPPATRRWFEQARRRGISPSMSYRFYRNGNMSDFRSVLPMIRIPTLVTICTDDQDFAARSHHVTRNITDAREVMFPGSETLAYVTIADEFLDEVEEFLTGTRSHRVDDRVLATVMFTDLVDSTRIASELGDHAWNERLDRHDALVRAHLDRFRGREVKTLGDGFLAVFDGPARAARCAQAIIDDTAELELSVRAGLHTGEIELRGTDVAGTAVNICARVAAQAGPREVLVSRTVVDLVVGSGLRFDDRGEHKLKGIDGAWRLYAVERS
jgi:class 3 adenylate cyclase